MNVPASSNREQDSNEPQPPQARFPHKDRSLVATGKSPILQLRPDLGLKISAVLIVPLVPNPPTVRIPAWKHFVKIDIINNSLIEKFM